MADITSNCKNALQRLGVTTAFLSIDDDTRNGRACALAYETVRDAELRKHYWRFAIKRTVLSPDVTVPVFDFLYAFTLPADCVRIIKPTDPLLDWQLEGRKILTNQSNVLNLRYISNAVDESLWDASFVDMFCLKLADGMCEAVTQSTQKKAGIDADYKEALQIAKTTNAFETIPAVAEDGSWILARN